jgi:Second Messenger Oligonucleotide or Dinucleotide Synthetase domain
MITTLEAFKKFKSRLELRDGEQRNASKTQKEIRELIDTHFSLTKSLLTGSYGRHTKTRPLKDVDIFFVLDKTKESKYLDKPLVLLDEFRKVLEPKYGKDKVKIGRRSIGIDLPVDINDEDKILSIDAVPAFDVGNHYKIPDNILKIWIETDPEVHAEETTAANKAFDGEWKPLVKMIKKWNETQGKPIKPSFLIEVMALQILYPPFSGGYIYELKSFFATAADRIGEAWQDPAGLGSAVSDQMDSQKITNARQKLSETGKFIDQAIQTERNGNQGGSLRIWRDNIFGDMFPLS